MIYCLRNMIYDKSYDIFAAGCDIMSVPIIYRRYISPVLKRTDIIEKSVPMGRFFFCEDRTIEMFLRFRCLDSNHRHNHFTSLRFCFQGFLQRHLDFSAADKDHLYFLF